MRPQLRVICTHTHTHTHTQFREDGPGTLVSCSVKPYMAHFRSNASTRTHNFVKVDLVEFLAQSNHSWHTFGQMPVIIKPAKFNKPYNTATNREGSK